MSAASGEISADRRPAVPLNSYLLRSAVVAALGELLFGFDTAVISGTTRSLTETFWLSLALLGITVSSALWGTVAGAFGAGRPADRFGRRPCLLALGALYLASAIGCVLAWSWAALIFFRIIGGLAIGAPSVIGFTHWFMNALISAVFPLMAARSGATPLVFFALMMAAQFFVVLKFYPETARIRLEEVEHCV